MPPGSVLGGDQAGLSRKQIGWFLLSRLVTITLLFIATIVYQLQARGEVKIYPLLWLYFLVAISYAQHLFSTLLIKWLTRFKLFVQSQIGWDLVFATLFIYLTGGIASPFPFLYILVILTAAAFCSRRECYLVASFSAILYGSLLDLQFYGYLPVQEGYIRLRQTDGLDVLYAVFVNVLAFFLTAFLGGLIAERLRRSEQALKRKEIDYNELDSLNRAIVANSGSGLMTINRQGRIRVFNQGAERIACKSLAEVYDQDVRDIFPAMKVYDGEFILNPRGEGSLAYADGSRRIVGFSTSLIEEQSGKVDGLLVTFQDLTRLKEAEEQVKRNDRLAAVGHLAAGMAHEIRNPLASISGSVQLLLENGKMSEDDQRLMRIVVREADRLNRLLADFLKYAHPAPLQLESTDLSHLLEEVADIAAADPRFAQITIRREYPRQVVADCDRGKILQSVWNLLINAAEAMPGGGEIFLDLDPSRASIVVEDTGPGISPDVMSKIFNPFYTTKNGGTGLGLSTTYSTLEAHGGSIVVSSGRKGVGSRFVLYLAGT